MKRLLLVLKAFTFALVSSGNTKLSRRLNFVSTHGRKRQRWLETAILFSLLIVSYFTLRRRCRRRQAQSPLFRLKPSLLAVTVAFGALAGLANYLCLASLPVSTSSLGLALTIAFGMFVVPMIEKRLGDVVLAMGLVWAAVFTVWVLVIEDCEAVARAYGLGEAAYLAVVVSSEILCQGLFWGSGRVVVHYLSALLAGGGVTMLLLPGGSDTFFFLQLIRVEKAVSLFVDLCYVFGNNF